MSADPVSISGAEQILRPDRAGRPYLRGDIAARQTLEPGALSVRDGVIAGVADDPSADSGFDARGCAVIPGFVDCHTHLPFVGWRAVEYEEKIAGVPYEQIARDGGGIASSARALSEATDEQVLAQSVALAGEMAASGTTTFECKSGYGLSREGELRALELARTLDSRVAQTTTSTALLAHAVPPLYSATEWMDEVETMMPEVVRPGSVSALDIFVESIAFSNADLTRMGALAAGAGLALRCHVEQFGGLRSVPVALAAGARSVDHLSTLHEDDIPSLAQAECAAVLLPGAEFLGAEHRAPGRDLIDAGAIVVLATDGNPGTAPVFSVPLVIGLAVRLYRLTALEAVAAATLNSGLDARVAGRSGLNRGRQARRPGRARWTCRADRLPLWPQPGVGRVRSGGAGVRPRRRPPEVRGPVRRASVAAMANAHSHAFQLDLRGVAERPHPGDDFWSWRNEMYRLAGSHDPDSMRAVGERVYAQMAAAGYGAVGEFHYVVRQPDGTPYDEPNAMAIALAEAAVAQGLEIVLLPAAYNRGGFGRPPDAGQRRFCDADVSVFLERLDALRSWASWPRAASTSASRRTAFVPSRLTGSRRSPSTPIARASSATCTRPSSGASWPSARPSMAARRSSCSTAAASSVRGRASCTRST